MYSEGYADYRLAQLATPSYTRVPTTLEAFKQVALTPLCSLADDFIEFPQAWLPAGVLSLLVNRSFRISDCRPPGMNEGQCRLHEVTLRRILYGMWYVPRPILGSRGKGGLIAPSSFCRRANTLLRMARWSLTNRYHESLLFAHLSAEDVRLLAEMGHWAHSVVRDMWLLGKTAHISDVPAQQSELNVTTEPDRKVAALKRTKEKTPIPFLPFTDEFTTALGWRCIWLVENLGPALLDLKEKCDAQSAPGGSPENAESLKRLDYIVRHYEWRDSEGNVMGSLPFEMNIRRGRKGRCDLSEAWPPQTYGELNRLLTALQTAHFVVLALSIGARDSELKSCSADSVIESTSDRLSSSTYKQSNRIGGIERDFPLPPIAARAILQQSRFAQMFHKNPAGPLFVILNNTKQKRAQSRAKGDAQSASNDMVRALVDRFGLTSMLNGESPHTHRFRKTIARLVALALVDAPKVLFDLFGHENMQQTLYYMLSDKQILAELNDVAERMAHAMTGKVLADLDSASGPAAPKLREAMESLRVQTGKERFDIDVIDEAIEVLSLVGVPFKIVLPDIMCTKQRHESGACDPDSPDPNPAHCKPQCNHRLELGSAKAQVDRTIAYIVEKLAAAADMSEMIKANWRGQLLHHLQRFADIRAVWLAKSEIAAMVWAEGGASHGA